MAIGQRRLAWGEAAAIALALTAGEWPCAGAWRSWGSLPTENSWVQFVGKFCFDYSIDESAGKFSVSLSGSVIEPPVPASHVQEEAPCWGPCDPDGGLYFIMYDDEETHWRAAHRKWETLTCKERLADASWAQRLSPMNGSAVLRRQSFVNEKLQPRFWYFSFAACGVQQIPKTLEYQIHAENILMGWQREFGVDTRDSLSLQVLFTLIFACLAWGLKVSSARPDGESFRARPLLRLLVSSAACAALGCGLFVAHNLVYMRDGVGLRSIEVCGVLLACSSKAMLTVLQLLMAKGWVLFYSPHEIAWRRFTFLSLGGIILLSALCELHGQYAHDWRTTLYMYQSIPGTIILLLNVMLFVEAMRSTCERYTNETVPEVREFYTLVSAANLTYFLALPVICILAGVFKPWVRQKYVERTEIISRFFAMLLLSYCLRPSHVDTIINARLEDGLESEYCDSDRELLEMNEDDREESQPLTLAAE